MITTDDLAEFLAFQPSRNRIIGYHSSVRSACAGIEEFGFLPDKILPFEDHARLIEMAAAYKVEFSGLQSWLAMRSVTFTQRPDDALKHVKQGSTGGQGLKNLSEIIDKLPSRMTAEERTFIDYIARRISEVRADQPVTYVVDLSDLGPRLDPDKVQPFYYYRWHSEKELPRTSEIGPNRILARLNHK